MPQPVKPLPSEDLEHVLKHTRELWSEASGKSFFITGGTGFFGMGLLESFCSHNDLFALSIQATVLDELLLEKLHILAAGAFSKDISGHYHFQKSCLNALSMQPQALEQSSMKKFLMKGYFKHA